MTSTSARISQANRLGRRCYRDVWRGELKMVAKKLRRPAQRNAMTFSAESKRFLEYVRFAVTMTNKDDREFERAVAGLADQGLLADLLEEWTLSRDHFKGLANLCDTAARRSFLVMERLGYSRYKSLSKRSSSRH